MPRCRLGLVLLLTAVLPPGQAAVAQDGRDAIVAAARELNRALDLLQDVLTNDPGPIQFKGLYTQSLNIQVDLASFRDQLRNKASRDDLSVAFDAVDRKIKGVVDLLEGSPMLTAGLRLAVQED